MYAPSKKTCLAILDRDGTINVDRGFVHRWEDWQFCPGTLDALHRLQRAGFQLILVTNQSGIGRGLYTVQDVEWLHEQVDQYLKQLAIEIQAYLYCPHAPETACRCRKPNTKLIEEYVAERRLVVDWRHSWTIGDKPSDVTLGKRLGTRTALLRSQYWTQEALDVAPDVIAISLLDAVQFLLASSTVA